jgi:hypothetical protein
MTRRHLDEVIRSQNVMLERKGKEGGDIAEDKIKEIFKAQLAQVDKYLEDHDNFAAIYVNYNEMIADPRPTAVTVNEFLGGTLDVEAMVNVVEPALYRQRQAKTTQM